MKTVLIHSREVCLGERNGFLRNFQPRMSMNKTFVPAGPLINPFVIAVIKPKLITQLMPGTSVIAKTLNKLTTSLLAHKSWRNFSLIRTKNGLINHVVLNNLLLNKGPPLGRVRRWRSKHDGVIFAGRVFCRHRRKALIIP